MTRSLLVKLLMDWILEIFRENAVIPIFLTLGLGFWLGSLRWRSVSLGPVTATLIVGVVVGQTGIEMSETLKSVAFMLFLFAIGYSVGPQFFRSLKGEGLKQIGFAVVEAVVCIGCTLGICGLMGYNKGMTVGVFAGAQTVSASMGVGADCIRAMGIDDDLKRSMIGIIPACYAVTYVFGTIGTAWIIANLGPVLLGGLKKVKEQTAELEAELDKGDFVPCPGAVNANRPISFRAYRAESGFFNRPRSVEEIEGHIRSMNRRHFVERLRVGGEVTEPEPDVRVRRGDVIVLSGRRESIVEEAGWIGPEVTDHELLNFSAENLRVTVSKSGAAGLTLGELKGQPFMRGVLVNKVLRNDMPIPVRNGIELERGDVVTLVGLPQDVAGAVGEIGYADRETGVTDVTFIGLGIALGCLVGAVTVYCDGLPITLSTSGGAILAGLVMGWWRSRRPTFGQIPRPVLWFMNQVGLNLFIAVVGISAGPTFVDGLKEMGVGLFLVGIVATTVPLVVSIFIATKIFRFPAAVALGCVAGSRNAVAALGAIEDALESKLPVIGYTVTYAVSSLLLILAGMVVALLS